MRLDRGAGYHQLLRELSATVRPGRPWGLTSRLIGKATEAMLMAGALDRAAGRIALSAEGVMA